MDEINEKISKLELNSIENHNKNKVQKEHKFVIEKDSFEILHDAYIRYNYILENVDFDKEKLFIKNNIKIYNDNFIEYKMDISLLLAFVENIDCEIESYFN